MADLSELFARLNGGASGNQQQQQHSNLQPSVSSPLFSPQPTGPQPHHQSAIMSPNSSMANTPAPEQGHASQQTPQQQSTNLLNLLRFNSHSGRQPQRQVSQHTTQVTDASDLMANVMGTRAASQGAPAPAQAMPVPAQQNPQDLLLRLLNHPKPAQQASGRSSRAASTAVASNKPETVVDDLAQDLADAELEQVPSDPAASTPAAASPMRVFGSDGQEPASTRFQPEPTALAPKFTYVNPFDQLEAASPRNRTPIQQASKPPAPSPAPARKVEILKKNAFEAPVPTAREEAHTHETVAEAVSDLGEQVGQQIEEALAEAETAAHVPEELEDLPAEDIAEIQEVMAEIATEIKADFADASKAEEIEAALPKPLAAALKEVATEVADDSVADNWETAEAEESMAKDDQTVIVYRFPMRAFASIQVNEIPSRRLHFANELFMDIARLKKDFDQIDRSLVAASKNFIVYALVKKGGFRIIRQENGHYRQVFENHQERIFNIALCTAADDSPSQQSLESILGIGVNGTVFWTSLDPAREDQFGENLDSQGLMLPPSPSQDDNTSGGQLKTRAKPSSRHPEFFAVGRGKSIHIVFPRVAAEYARTKSRICHTEKYLKERSLKILTGKAGKDFTFSEDDTIIVSLDKAGRMRFWDIRTLTDPDLGNPRSPPRQVEVSETLLEFHTTTPNAKSWPTSVFFFDKDKPYTKGIALRYVMVGMKQNHAFQLWDLGLNKAVQEIHLPHENESDAICSVSFHPRTGIMAVAHPTRNSIFFVHVSCPRYNLPVLSQAAYISRLANKGDRGQLPPVNATAIMTSITEYSFASKGQIRSLHMLNEPAGPADVDDPDNAALFELYVMHSKGVCVLRIRRSDLGWKKEGEPINPREAEEEGVITITQLKPPQPVTTDESSTAGDVPAPKSVSDRSARETLKREESNVSRQSINPEAAMRASTLAKVESKQDAARAAIINGGDKAEKKKKKRSTAETASQVSASASGTVSGSTSIRAPAPPSYAQAAQATQATPQSRSPAPPEAPVESAKIKADDNEAPEWAKQLISKHFQQPSAPSAESAPAPAAEFDAQKLEEIVQAEITKGFSRELEVMYKRIDEDKRVMNAANGAKQEAILRMVSSTLNENVEGVIRKMVDDNIRNVLLPEVLAKTSATLEQGLGTNIKSTLGPLLAKEVPDAVSRALKHPQMFQSLSDQVAKKITGNFEPMVVASVGTVVNPAISNLSSLIERQIGAELRQAHAQRREDAAKIAQLTDTVHTCLETIQTMVATQAELQSQVAKLHQAIEEREGPRGVRSVYQGSPQVTRSPPKKTPEELELESIAQLMSEGNYEQGTMMWLQSPRSSALFDSVFVRCDPSYLSQVSPLLALSTGAVVSDSLGRNLTERLMWLDAVLRSVNANVSITSNTHLASPNMVLQDAEIRDIIPKIMDVVIQRLTAAYIQLNESTSGSPLLRIISQLVNKCNEMTRAAVPFSPRG
jgi:hypothetical protein